MAGRARDLIAADVHKLITQLSGFSETEDPENFELCEKFAFSNLLHHRYLSVDSHSVRRSVFGMVTKFMIHGHIEASRRLDSLLNRYLKLDVFKDKDVQWAILSLLVKLADNPTNHIDDDKYSFSQLENVEDESKPFDWTTYSHLCDYLKEGNEKFNTNFNSSSDSEWEDVFSDHDGSPKITESETCKTTLVPQIKVPQVLVPPEEAQNTEQKQLVEHHRRCITAEAWLSENIQNPWWDETQFTERVNSVFPSANLAKIWDSYCDESSSTLSEYKVLREILWMLQSPTSTTLFQEIQGQFSVHPNMTIPSLTKSSTSGYLTTLCEYFTMIFNLQKFQKEIFPVDSNITGKLSVKEAPHTFEAYTAAVVEFLRTIQGLACEIEKKVKRQEDSYTLYSLNLELAPKMSQLRSVYKVHMNATKDWKESENWLNSAKLLSVLYSEALSCMECDSPCVLLKMFLKSFRPYVDMIDLWLTEGRLEDCRNEFIITKRDLQESEQWGDDFTMRPFIDILKSNNITPLPLLQVIVDKVLHAGRNMQLLQRLDRLGDMRSQNSNCGRMYAEFLIALEKEVALLTKENSEVEVNACVKEPNMSDAEKCPVCPDQFMTDVTNQLEELKDNFLMQAFKDYIPFKSLNQKKDPETLNTSGDVFKRLAMYSTCGVMPLKPVMERILSQLIDAKHSTACLLVKNIFLQEFNLSTHLSLIRAIYLMEAGDIMHRFCLFIFTEAERSLLWANSYTLTVQLEECINLRYPDHSSKFSVAVREDAKLNGTSSVMEEINIEYHVDWPLTVILSPKNMEYYNTVFQFLLKVKWALWTLEGLRFSDLSSTSNLNPELKCRARCLHLLRFWLLHSIGSVHTYLMGQVLHSLGLQLEQDLKSACDLDSLVQAHNKYVNLVHNHCLQPRSNDVIKTAILQMVHLSLELHDIWSQGVDLVQESKLLSMTDMYIKCHCFLGSVLQTAVDLGQAAHLTAPVSFSSSSALNKSSIFADHMQYSLAFLAWQQDLPLGISSPLPKYLHKYLENDIWNEKRSDVILNTHKLEIFLDNYFLYLSGMRKHSSSKTSIPHSESSYHVIQSKTQSMHNGGSQNIRGAVSSLHSETCVSEFSFLQGNKPKQEFISKHKIQYYSANKTLSTKIQKTIPECFEMKHGKGSSNVIESDTNLHKNKCNKLEKSNKTVEGSRITIPKFTPDVKQSCVYERFSKPNTMNVAYENDEKNSKVEQQSTDEKCQELTFVNLQVLENKTSSVNQTVNEDDVPTFSSVLRIEENYFGIEKKSAIIGLNDESTTKISTSLISCTIPWEDVEKSLSNSKIHSYPDVFESDMQETSCPTENNVAETSLIGMHCYDRCKGLCSTTSNDTSLLNIRPNEKSLLLNQRTLKSIRQKCVKPNIKHSSKSGRRFYDCGSNMLPKTSLNGKVKKKLIPSIFTFEKEYLIPISHRKKMRESSPNSQNSDENDSNPSLGVNEKSKTDEFLSKINKIKSKTGKERNKDIQKNQDLLYKWDESINKLSSILMRRALLNSNSSVLLDSGSISTCTVQEESLRTEEKNLLKGTSHKSIVDVNTSEVSDQLKENFPYDRENTKEKRKEGRERLKYKDNTSSLERSSFSR